MFHSSQPDRCRRVKHETRLVRARSREWRRGYTLLPDRHTRDRHFTGTEKDSGIRGERSGLSFVGRVRGNPKTVAPIDEKAFREIHGRDVRAGVNFADELRFERATGGIDADI